MPKRTQPTWSPPQNVSKVLQLYNSLTKNKEDFIPQNGNKVLWYSCGPTVYDAAHMGHARSYISFDILRRVLSDYFRYDVYYVMNITDIDDKIIKRARQNYLFQNYVEEKSDSSTVLSDIGQAIKNYEILLEKAEDSDKKKMLQDVISSTMKVIEDSASQDLTNKEVLKELAVKSKDVLSEWLDSERGSSVTENSIFSELPTKYEAEFFADMESLEVREPDAVSRVSEYMDEIIQYVQKIIENGFAYESNGSVYFDTVKFNDTQGHFYGKLVPEAFGDLKKLEEGEGDLSINPERLQEKKNPSDFALWKISKPGEPSWDSPWGKGRPGWHIECSVMASALLGDSLDIHTGGYDLKFPHHDNEMAQAEAYFGNDHWVRYFLHSGHLTISGCKMSKSLKNFVTIRDALDYHSARQIRLAFLLHSWKDTLDYSAETLDKSLHYERTIKEFIQNVNDSTRLSPSMAKMNQEENELHKIFDEKKTNVHEALCDNIDTQKALLHIQELVRSSNKYMQNQKKNKKNPHRTLLKNILSYIVNMLKIFGAEFKQSTHTEENAKEVNQKDDRYAPLLDVIKEFLSSTQKRADVIRAHDISKLCEEFKANVFKKFNIKMDNSNEVLTRHCPSPGTVMELIECLVDFRENVRKRAKEIKAVDILKICDELRDRKLPELGIRIEDQEGTKAAIKLFDPEELAKERERQQKLEEKQREEKERKQKELEQLKATREALLRIPPKEYFKSMNDKYSLFDENGLPTHDAEGKELSEKQKKKVKKLYQTQEQKYKSYLQSVTA